MPCAYYTNPDLQNVYWEGFTQENEVTNLFVWNLFGECIHAAVNFPGSWHDSKIVEASGLYSPRLTRDTPSGFEVLCDSAFPSYGTSLQGKVVRARKANELGPSSDVSKSFYLSAVDTLFERAMPSERQSAEWGVRAMKCPFKRMTVSLPADVHSRYRILVICAHMFNFRTRFVGLNQLRTVYTKEGSTAQPWIQELVEGTDVGFTS